jgi:serine/threonine protein kinase
MGTSRRKKERADAAAAAGANPPRHGKPPQLLTVATLLDGSGLEPGDPRQLPPSPQTHAVSDIDWWTPGSATPKSASCGAPHPPAHDALAPRSVRAGVPSAPHPKYDDEDLADLNDDLQSLPSVDSDDDDGGGGYDATADATADASDDPFTLSHSVLVVQDEEGNDVVNGYTLWQELGRGAAGVVHMAIDEAANETKAIKVLNRDAAQREAGDCSLLSEVAIMKKVRHPHIVALYECIDDPVADSVYLVMQYVPDGPIRTLNIDGTCAPMPLDSLAAYVKQLAGALHYMHAKGVAHGDIKPDNILVDLRDGLQHKAFFADFGVSRTFLKTLVDAGHAVAASASSGQIVNIDGSAALAAPRRDTTSPPAVAWGAATTVAVSPPPAGAAAVLPADVATIDALLKRQLRPHVNLGLGSPAFLAPEVFLGDAPGFPADLWAFGVTLYVLVHGRLPFAGESYFAIKESVLTSRLEFPRTAQQATKKWNLLIQALLQQDPARRMTAGQLCRCRLVCPKSQTVSPQQAPRRPSRGAGGTVVTPMRSTHSTATEGGNLDGGRQRSLLHPFHADSIALSPRAAVCDGDSPSMTDRLDNSAFGLSFLSPARPSVNRSPVFGDVTADEAATAVTVREPATGPGSHASVATAAVDGARGSPRS